MTEFTPWSALAGGLLIGLAATLLLLLNGRIMGVSGILNGLIKTGGSPAQEDRLWRGLFLVAMVITATLLYQLPQIHFQLRSGFPIWALLLGGFLVGFGTRLGGGCTSGHGICGIGRLSRRSFAATACFFGVGVVTAIVTRNLIGVGL